MRTAERASEHSHSCGCPACCGGHVSAGQSQSSAVAELEGPEGLPAGMMGMVQRSVGNAAVAALIRGQGGQPGSRPAGGVLARRGFFGGAENEQEEYQDAIDAKRDFLSSAKGPANFRSVSGVDEWAFGPTQAPGAPAPTTAVA